MIQTDYTIENPNLVALKDAVFQTDQEVMVSISSLVFNHVQFIEEAIEGFLMQRTNFKVEIVIHDDASTDGTTDILRKYEAQYPHLVKLFIQPFNIHNHPNRFELRSAFLRARTGKYIALCEGDDYWTDPYKLQKQVDFLEANEEYIACFHNAEIHNLIENRIYNYHKWNESREVSAKEVIEIGGYVFPTAALVFRRSARLIRVENCNAGDLSLSLDLLSQGKYFYIKDFMCVYRRHSKGVYSGITKNILKMQKHEVSMIHLLENKRGLFAGKYDQYFNTAIKSRYKKLFTLYNYPLWNILFAKKYFSLREIGRLLKSKMVKD